MISFKKNILLCDFRHTWKSITWCFEYKLVLKKKINMFCKFEMTEPCWSCGVTPAGSSPKNKNSRLEWSCNYFSWNHKLPGDANYTALMMFLLFLQEQMFLRAIATAAPFAFKLKLNGTMHIWIWPFSVHYKPNYLATI